MCLHKRIVLSPTKSFNDGCTKVYNATSCGRCFECQCSEKSDWFLRNYAQWKDTTLKGGKTFFVTLTYADEFLPHFVCRYNKKNPDGSISETTINTSCFSLHDIQTFNNTLRKKLLRISKRLYNLDESYYHYKFIFFPEYGTKTKRPHYHCLFYFDKPISNKFFFQLIDGYDNDELRHRHFKFNKDSHYFKTTTHKNGLNPQGAWRKGWVLVSKPSKGGICVSSEKSIFYCSKYAVKDLSFYKKSDVSLFLSTLKDRSIEQPFDKYEVLKLFKQHCAIHRQSPSLGFDWLKTQVLLDPKKYLNDGFVITTGSKSSKSYFLPAYYKRKLFYKYYVISDPYSLDKVRWRFIPDNFPLYKQFIFNNIKKYCISTSHNCTYTHLNTLSLEHIYKLGFSNREDLYNYLQSFLSIYSIQSLAEFKYIFHNRNCSYDPITGEHFKTIDYDLQHYHDNIDKYLFLFLDNNNLPEYETSYFQLESSRYDSNYIYDNLKCFSKMSQFITLLDKINTYVRESTYNYLDYLDTFSSIYKYDDNTHSPSSYDLLLI